MWTAKVEMSLMQSDLDSFCSSKDTTLYNDSKSTQTTNDQISLHCTQIAYGPISCIAHHIILVLGFQHVF